MFLLVICLSFAQNKAFCLSCNMSFDRALESGEIVHIHPASVLFRSKPECVIFNELMQTSQKYIKNLTRIDPLWLAELAPHHYKTQE